ncbi:hypothetical protein [Rubellimicrobium aerolatum]|uniref:Lipoprotein n=1 Tax=Rubellimicrobium aerolatum TaxID=490979 RepID=A0ABW0SBM4_9RHOB|nr:hypothetical protein [Rubellimicrobium aerolatum]MBP1805878.1 hypothetical protein [Rubellimicrobium aerolatum]
MRTLGAALLAVALSGCVAGGFVLPAPGADRVSYQGRTWEVRRVAEEPRPDLSPEALDELPDGGLAVPQGAAFTGTGPAIRVHGGVTRQGASDVLAIWCRGRGRDVAPGWRGAPVRFDDTGAEFVFYTDC